MKYIGIDRQIRKNNFNSILLLLTFPLLLLLITYLLIFFIVDRNVSQANEYFLPIAPTVAIGAGIWFLIAWAGIILYLYDGLLLQSPWNED